ncbi:HAD family hydrolase, partial [Kitasatospora sp. NPDC054768]
AAGGGRGPRGARPPAGGPGLPPGGRGGVRGPAAAGAPAAHGKPDPELFLTAARRLGITPERCLAVDDAPDGVAAARAAGMRVLTMAGAHLAPVSSAPAGPQAPAARPADIPGPRPVHDPIR